MIIAFASSKGGVGKSTATASLAGAFAAQGYSTHIIDLDPNGTVSRWIGDGSAIDSKIVVSKPDPSQLSEHLKSLAATSSPEIILIDTAGTFELGLTVAVTRADLTIIPACTTEADVFEAARIAHHVETVHRKLGRKPLYRLLLTRMQPLPSKGQAHTYRQIAELRIPMFRALMVQRAAYEEIGYTGRPPHFGDQMLQSVVKAQSEIDALVDEIAAILDKHAEAEGAVA